MKAISTLVAIFIAVGSSDAVTVNVNCAQAPDLCRFGNSIKSTLQEWYPYLAYRLNSPTFKEITTIPLTFDLVPKYPGAVAYVLGGSITADVSYYRSHPEDVGSMIHELVHVIQGYRNCPSWVAEGMADYYRYYVYEPNNLTRKPRKPSSNNKWTEGYGTTAYFFDYVQNKYKPYDMLYWVNKDCREGTYSDYIWTKLLSTTLEQLWAEMLIYGK